MKEIPTRFTSYELTEEEYRQGCIFGTLNLAVLKNLRAEHAEEKLNIKYDPDSPMTFVQREAELQGVITVLDTIINAHEDVVTSNLNLNLNSNSQE